MPKDLAQVAIAMEEDGRDFYRGLAARAKNQKVSAIFTRLAAEEDEHAASFRRLLHGLSAPASGPQTAYLEALLAKVNEPAVGVLDDPLAALGVAVESEKEAILFYHELYNLAADEAAKAVISKIMREEKLHLVEIRERIEEGWD